MKLQIELIELGKLEWLNDRIEWKMARNVFFVILIEFSWEICVLLVVNVIIWFVLIDLNWIELIGWNQKRKSEGFVCSCGSTSYFSRNMCGKCYSKWRRVWFGFDFDLILILILIENERIDSWNERISMWMWIQITLWSWNVLEML